MQKKTKKTIAAVSAVAISLTLVFGSTLAWQSINQVARNKNAGTTNPGGRLHDDFDGENKDVYIENFGDGKIAVRVQLREFLEYGKDAGKADSGKNKFRTPVDSGASFDKPDNWPIHVPATDDPTVCKNNFHNHLKYTFGGQTVFLPTFNKNKDSLAPDINGTFEGTSAPFDDYVKYEIGTPVIKDEVYDADTNTTDEGNGNDGGKGGVLNENYTIIESVKHDPDNTINGEVVSMSKWISSDTGSGGKNKALGDFWVYDTDGWAYWANPLEPAKATGLLLDKVQVISEPADNYYFGIQVVSQMTSLGDLGENYKDGFWDPKKGSEPSANAQELLKKMGATSMPISLNDQIRAAEQKGTGDPNLTVKIDGVDFYVTKIHGNKALLMPKEVQGWRAFSYNKTDYQYWRWDKSQARDYFNTTWLDDKPTIRRIAEKTTLYTRLTSTGEDWYESVDKIFFISEADYKGTQNDIETSNVKDYSLGVAEKLIMPNYSSTYYHLRTPYSSEGNISCGNTNGTAFTYEGVTTTSYYDRPAFIVDIS